MFLFESSNYGEPISRLLGEARKAALGPGEPNLEMRPILAHTTAVELVPEANSNEMAACCLSAIWLWHDFLDESHEISQDLQSAEGSYWHGIMHRREPDYSNAKYWYRRVGDHAIFPDLLECVKDKANKLELDRGAEEIVSKPSWDPYSFVDLCADVAKGRSSSRAFCVEIATLEWQLLFDHCYRLACC